MKFRPVEQHVSMLKMIWKLVMPSISMTTALRCWESVRLFGVVGLSSPMPGALAQTVGI